MNICVFCGSAVGTNPIYGECARELGTLMARSSVNLVYGGGKVGLMGILADAVLLGGGMVTGIIPDFLMKREVGHQGITRLEIVNSMHDRKKRMADLADGFIALPGGWGTLDELAEILTWNQLGLVNRMVVLLNVGNFFDPLLTQMRLMVDEGFLRPAYLETLTVTQTPEEAISLFYPNKG